MKTADQIVDEIVAKLHRAGTFDAAKMPLIERFALCAVEQELILNELRRAPTESHKALRLSAVLASLTQEELQISLELELLDSESNADGAIRLNGLWVAAAKPPSPIFSTAAGRPEKMAGKLGAARSGSPRSRRAQRG